MRTAVSKVHRFVMPARNQQDSEIMTDAQLIKAIAEDREDNYAVDEACYRRLKKLALDYGQNGEIARRLLDIVKELLDA